MEKKVKNNFLITRHLKDHLLQFLSFNLQRGRRLFVKGGAPLLETSLLGNRSSQGQRIVVVSNRLPFTVIKDHGKIEFQESAGGVATGLSAFLRSTENSSARKRETVWVGWPGGTVGPEFRETVKSEVLSQFRCYPVFLSEDEVGDFYEGFCNKTLWPLFHYFPSHARYDPQYWLQYKKVNEAFAAAILEVVRRDDVLWIHDYHLMLLPNLIRQQRPDASIGFFLHIPFPQFEIFRLLPGKWRREILEGLLGADLIGFHTYDYVEYFLRSVLRILGYEHNMGQLTLHDRIVKVDTFPMGVDVERFRDATGQSQVSTAREEMQTVSADCKIVLSVDRQDYSKGIINRLQGFEALLASSPEWRGKVTLIMVVVPSRIGIEDYAQTKKQLEELVGKINGEFGSLHWVPIIYQYRALSFDSLVALYAMSHVALVTPLRDGMNLIAKEYVASRRDETGVLILSEMAGAAKELGEAIIINPSSKEEIAEALKTALEMPCEEQVRRNRIMQNRLRRYSLSRWATDFLEQLISMKQAPTGSSVKLLNVRAKSELLLRYHRSARRLFLLDYDGTLVGFVARPELAKPTRELCAILSALAADSRNKVILTSGRDKGTLQDWFGSLGLGLVAEHGAWIKEGGQDWEMSQPLACDWKPKLLPILDKYADRLPGAFVEEKEFSVSWHYRGADPLQGRVVARELADHLLTFTSNIDVQILQGNKVVEVRNAGVNKGTITRRWLAMGHDFILAIGDDVTDEDTFAVLPDDAYSICVGIGQTRARFNLREPGEVLELLTELFDTSSNAPPLPVREAVKPTTETIMARGGR
jgi:trehalose 6-phosphate synthase/phosphatase